MLFVYSLFTYLLYPFILLAPLISKKAKNFLIKRKLDKVKILKAESISGRVIWLHAASVGELDQCKAFAKRIKGIEPNTKIIQSVFSDSVQEMNFDSEFTSHSFRLPLDFYFAYDFIFEKFHPAELILMAWETWPNLIHSAKRHNCQIFLACAVLDPKSKRASFLLQLFTKSVFKNLDGISPVNENMNEAFLSLTDSKVKVKSCGDARFESVVDKILSKKPDKVFTEFATQYKSERILILASTYSECDQIIFSEIKSILSLGYSIWIFPHKIDSSRIESISFALKAKNHNFSLYSQLKNPCKDRIILFDALGILAFAYFYGNLAYIGGAMHNKVHNVLEPAFFGLPLITGKRIYNSYDARRLEELESLKTINTSQDFLEAIKDFSKKDIFERVNNINKEYINSNLGSSLAFYNTFLKT